MPRTSKEPVIRSGSERGDHRRTLIDDRSGIVVDVNQSGSDETPTTTIELYPWASGYTVEVTTLPWGHHPAIVLTRVKEDE